MSTATLDKPEQSAATDIVTVVAQTPVVVLLDEAKRSSLYDHIRREVEAFEPDVTTNKGREAIRSLAYKITRTKTAIDAAGKQLNEEARSKINVVDAARRDARETLDRMADEVRRPLTEWEDAEKARVAECQEVIDWFKSASVVTLDDNSMTVRARGNAAYNMALLPDHFREMLDEAQAAKDATIGILKTALTRLEREEAERAELERLRAEDEARRQREAEEQAAREATERAEREAKEAEERRIANEKAEAERIERAKQEAAEAERQRVEREHAEALAAERRRAEEAERAAQADRDRIAAEEQARKDSAAKEAAEQAEREADQKHRAAIMKAAKEAIMTCGVDEDAAKKIVLLIRSGEVPNVTLRF